MPSWLSFPILKHYTSFPKREGPILPLLKNLSFPPLFSPRNTQPKKKLKILLVTSNLFCGTMLTIPQLPSRDNSSGHKSPHQVPELLSSLSFWPVEVCDRQHLPLATVFQLKITCLMTLTVKIMRGLRTFVTFHWFYVLYLCWDEQVKQVAYPEVPQHRAAACNSLGKVSYTQKESISSAQAPQVATIWIPYSSLDTTVTEII